MSTHCSFSRAKEIEDEVSGKAAGLRNSMVRLFFFIMNVNAKFCFKTHQSQLMNSFILGQQG